MSTALLDAVVKKNRARLIPFMLAPVSYNHLNPPANKRVVVPGGAVSLKKKNKKHDKVI